MARHDANRAERAEKCMFAGPTFADYAAKRGYPSDFWFFWKSGVSVSVCVDQGVLITEGVFGALREYFDRVFVCA